MILQKDKNASRIIADQKLFFNLNARKKTIQYPLNRLFELYFNEIQSQGFEWISKEKKILDYGCGTATSINLFIKHRNSSFYDFYGVDIAEEALKRARIKYPQFKFFKIKNNKIPQLSNNFLDAVIMSHILHHSHNHFDIFREIHSKLKKGGKFLIIDLTSNNLLIKLGRLFFLYLPPSLKDKFYNDLVVNGKVPEKYKVNLKKVTYQLEKVGFVVEEINYGHLFFFVFGWIEIFIPFSKNKIFYNLYKKLINLEKFLLQYKIFRQSAEMFYIKCKKKS